MGALQPFVALASSRRAGVSVLLSRQITAFIAALSACGSPRPAGPLSVVDGLGREVSLERPARRIVSLSPATTELVFALGAGSRLVGRTRWCDYPAEVAAIISVGAGLNPSIEAVAAQKPDLVVMYSTAGNDGAVAQLAGLGIPAVNLPMDRLSDVIRSARLLGVLLGDSIRADSIAFAFQRTLAQLHQNPALIGPTVAMVVWDNPPMVIGAGSFMSELVELAGARNVFADLPQPSPTVSIETIASRNPDLLLVHGDTGLPAWARRPEWRAVRAVREGRFAHLHGSQFERPSLRAPDAVRALVIELGRARPR